MQKRLELFSLKNSFKQENLFCCMMNNIKDDKIVGYTSSSNFSFIIKNICLAYINGEIKDYENLSVEVEGERYSLKFEKKPIHDQSLY